MLLACIVQYIRYNKNASELAAAQRLCCLEYVAIPRLQVTFSIEVPPRSVPYCSRQQHGSF